MTCDEVRETIKASNPWDVPRAVLGAVIDHLGACEPCRLRVQERMKAQLPAYMAGTTPEEQAAIKKATYAAVEEMLADPEASKTAHRVLDLDKLRGL